MSQTGYCPRGPFCAFAHVEQEIRVLDDETGVTTATLADGNLNKSIKNVVR